MCYIIDVYKNTNLSINNVKEYNTTTKLMKFRIASDLHLEFRNNYLDQYTLPTLEGDKETILLLAGDIGLLGDPRTYSSFMKHSSEQFKGIFWIAGNHEYYHTNIDMKNIRMAIDDLALPNIYTDLHILEEEKIAIIGSTLWTSFNNGDPASVFIAQRGMSDFHVIESGITDQRLRPTLLRAERTIEFHKEEKNRIFMDVNRYSAKGYKCIVVTHHQPSWQGIGEGFAGNSMNSAFVSNMDAEIEGYDIAYWIAGHTHNAKEYMIGETKVIVNPLGYPSERDAYFNSTLTIEV